MNDRTLAQQIQVLVAILDARADRQEIDESARHGYLVARNLMAQAIVEVKHANRLAMQEVKAVKEVSR